MIEYYCFWSNTGKSVIVLKFSKFSLHIPESLSGDNKFISKILAYLFSYKIHIEKLD